MNRFLLFLTLLLAVSHSLMADDCIISYRYVRELKANYYDVYAGGKLLSLKFEDHGCIDPLCALRKAKKLEQEGQCEIKTVACQYRYSDKYIRKGTTMLYRKKKLMASMEGSNLLSQEVEETLDEFVRQGYCSSFKEVH